MFRYANEHNLPLVLRHRRRSGTRYRSGSWTGWPGDGVIAALDTPKEAQVRGTRFIYPSSISGAASWPQSPVPAPSMVDNIAIGDAGGQASPEATAFAPTPTTACRTSTTRQLPDGSTGVWTAATLREGPAWAPFFINYGFPADAWIRRDHADSTVPWSLDSIVIETPDGGEGAKWLARVLGATAGRVSQEIGRVPLPGCGIVLVPGPADRITTVALTGPAAPTGEVAGLRYVRATGEP